MGTIKPTSHHIIQKKSLTRPRLLIFIPLILTLLFTSFFALKYLCPHHKHPKDTKYDFKRLENRLEESQHEVKRLTKTMAGYQQALSQLLEDFNNLKKQSYQTSNGGQNHAFVAETRQRLDQHEDKLDSLTTHVMMAMQDIEDIREGPSPYYAWAEEAQREEKTETLEEREDGDGRGSFTQWKKELSEAVKQSLNQGREITNRAVEKAKETTKAMGQKMEETGSKIKREVYDGAKKTKEFFTEKGHGVKSAMNSFGEKAKEQTKKLAQSMKNQAKSMVKKVNDWKDSFMKMFR